MNDFEFAMRFNLPDPNGDPADYVGPLMDAGCNDALIGIARRGRIALNFTRSADSLWAALASARDAVTLAIPGAQLVKVELA